MGQQLSATELRRLVDQDLGSTFAFPAFVDGAGAAGQLGSTELRSNYAVAVLSDQWLQRLAAKNKGYGTMPNLLNSPRDGQEVLVKVLLKHNSAGSVVPTLFPEEHNVLADVSTSKKLPDPQATPTTTREQRQDSVFSDRFKWAQQFWEQVSKQPVIEGLDSANGIAVRKPHGSTGAHAGKPGSRGSRHRPRSGSGSGSSGRRKSSSGREKLDYKPPTRSSQRRAGSRRIKPAAGAPVSASEVNVSLEQYLNELSDPSAKKGKERSEGGGGSGDGDGSGAGKDGDWIDEASLALRRFIGKRVTGSQDSLQVVVGTYFPERERVAVTVKVDRDGSFKLSTPWVQQLIVLLCSAGDMEMSAWQAPLRAPRRNTRASSRRASVADVFATEDPAALALMAAASAKSHGAGKNGKSGKLNEAQLPAPERPFAPFQSRQANILPIFQVVETPSAYYLVASYHKLTLEGALKHSWLHLMQHELQLRFMLYQLLCTLNYLHSNGITHGALTPAAVIVAQPYWVYVTGIEATADPDHDHHTHQQQALLTPGSDKQARAAAGPGTKAWREIVRTLTELARPMELSGCGRLVLQWVKGEITNFAYVMGLNRMAGRRFGDPNSHPVVPWVLAMRDGKATWRDLRRSKYRLTKGDMMLDMTYDSESNPHHVTDLLTEVTYFMYLARRTPIDVLRRYVRSHFEPKEYPVSVEFMYNWTPDESIPELYTDPSVFRSMHKEMQDMTMPAWAKSPEDFIAKHMEAFESEYVSNHLHHWVDLTFGYLLTGDAAVKAKNVPLVRRDVLIGTGYVQLFTTPHPRREVVPRSTSAFVRQVDRATPAPAPVAAATLVPDAAGVPTSSGSVATGDWKWSTMLRDGQAAVRRVSATSAGGSGVAGPAVAAAGAAGTAEPALDEPSEPARFVKQLAALESSTAFNAAYLQPACYAPLNDAAHVVDGKLDRFQAQQSGDMFAFGCLLAEAYLGRPLLTRARRDALYDGGSVPMLRQLGSPINAIVQQLVSPDARTRPSALQVMRNPFFPAFFADVYNFLAEFQLRLTWQARLDWTMESWDALMELDPSAFELVVPFVVPFYSQRSTIISALRLFDPFASKLGRSKTLALLLQPVRENYLGVADASDLAPELLHPIFIATVSKRFGLTVFSSEIVPCVLGTMRSPASRAIAEHGAQALLTIAAGTTSVVAGKHVVIPLLGIVNRVDKLAHGDIVAGTLAAVLMVTGQPAIVAQFVPHLMSKLAAFNKPTSSSPPVITAVLLAVLRRVRPYANPAVLLRVLVQDYPSYVAFLARDDVPLTMRVRALDELLAVCKAAGRDHVTTLVLPALRPHADAMFPHRIRTFVDVAAAVDMDEAITEEGAEVQRRGSAVRQLTNDMLAVSSRLAKALGSIVGASALEAEWGSNNLRFLSAQLPGSADVAAPVLPFAKLYQPKWPQLVRRPAPWRDIGPARAATVEATRGTTHRPPSPAERPNILENLFGSRRRGSSTTALGEETRRRGSAADTSEAWVSTLMQHTSAARRPGTWALQNKVLRRFRAHAESVRATAVHDSEQVFATGSKDGSVRIWRLDEVSAELSYRHHTSPIKGLAFDAVRGTVISCGAQVHVWNTESGEQVQTFANASFTASTPLEAQNQVIAATSSGTVMVLDTNTGMDVCEWRLPDAQSGGVARSVAVNSGESYIAVGMSTGSAGLLDERTGLLTANWHAHDGAVNQVSVLDDHTVVTGGADKLLKVWSVENDNPRLLRAFKGLGEAVVGFGISRNTVIACGVTSVMHTPLAPVGTDIGSVVKVKAIKAPLPGVRPHINSLNAVNHHHLLVLGVNDGSVTLLT